MDDYIKRADAINSTWKALYAYEDRTEEQFQNDPDLDLGDWALHRIFVQGVHAEGLKEIIGIPAADVAPVVRCKDCEHFAERGICKAWNTYGPTPTPDDGYCYRGVKRDG